MPVKSKKKHKGQRLGPRSVTQIDTIIGEQLRRARMARGITMQVLADKIDLSVQQVQKYEKGMNRVSVGTLLQLCGALDKSVAYFLRPVIAHHLTTPVRYDNEAGAEYVS